MNLYLHPTPGKGALTEHWNEFNLACDTDAPITPVIDMVRQLSGIYTLWFVTGRCEIARDKTRAWLRKHVTNGAEPLWICPYISRHLLSLNPLLACCRRYSRGER